MSLVKFKSVIEIFLSHHTIGRLGYAEEKCGTFIVNHELSRVQDEERKRSLPIPLRIIIVSILQNSVGIIFFFFILNKFSEYYFPVSLNITRRIARA